MEPIRNSHHLNTMQLLKNTLVLTVLLSLTGCAAVPFGIGLIPGAPSYFSSIIGNGQSAYETAMDERSTEQQMRDAIIAGHAQAELYKHKEIRPSRSRLTATSTSSIWSASTIRRNSSRKSTSA